MKPCRCLLREVEDRKDFWTAVQDHLESLPPEYRADEEEYETRLKCCKECARLVNGFCGLCGCVVELRAAKRFMGCPDSPSKWKPMKRESTG